MNSIRRILCVLLLVHWCLGLKVLAADQTSSPTFRTFLGELLVDNKHAYFVDSELRLPIFSTEHLGLSYEHHETTPFLRFPERALQPDVLYTRDQLKMDFKLSDQLSLMTAGGYQASYLEDRSGLMSAYAIGAGIGSPSMDSNQSLQWHALAGTYLSRHNLSPDWWTDLSLSWRVFQFAREEYMGSDYRAFLALAASVDSSSEGDQFKAVYRMGPELRLLTASGNQASLAFQWYRNDNNPFYGREANGLMVGFEVKSSLDKDYVFDAREKRQSGWFPLIWGDYDVALANTRRIQRFVMNAEVVDFKIRDQLFTGVVWYESRQEHRIGDFDNIAYSVSTGIQTPIGLESVFSQGKPLILGMDYLHKSSHVLNPDPDRVASFGEPTSIGPLIKNGYVNLFPRLRLQTLGWDLPYRDPSLYDKKTAWLNCVDWRLTVAYDIHSTRDRGRIAGQLGAHWDIGTLFGYVFYLHGVGSMGNEVPDWQGEFGVRRPAGNIFLRYESYGSKPNVGRGDALTTGIGFSL